jgi:hypothetical protein
MPVLSIHLSSPSLQPGDAPFTTLVSVTAADLASDRHVEIAKRRARIHGLIEPIECVAVRTLSTIAPTRPDPARRSVR